MTYEPSSDILGNKMALVERDSTGDSLMTGYEFWGTQFYATNLALWLPFWKLENTKNELNFRYELSEFKECKM